MERTYYKNREETPQPHFWGVCVRDDVREGFWEEVFSELSFKVEEGDSDTLGKGSSMQKSTEGGKHAYRLFRELKP